MGQQRELVIFTTGIPDQNRHPHNTASKKEVSGHTSYVGRIKFCAILSSGWIRNQQYFGVAEPLKTLERVDFMYTYVVLEPPSIQSAAGYPIMVDRIIVVIT